MNLQMHTAKLLTLKSQITLLLMVLQKGLSFAQPRVLNTLTTQRPFGCYPAHSKGDSVCGDVYPFKVLLWLMPAIPSLVL